MSMRDLLDVGSTVVVTAAAITMVGFYLVDRRATSDPPERHVEEWKDWSTGIPIGSEDGELVVDVFMDFTCPHCRNLVPVLDSARAEFGGDLTVRFHHFPLIKEGVSLKSAVAAECADQQDRFEEMFNTLYDQQDALAETSWIALAEDASLPDLQTFEECMAAPSSSFERIESGRALGESLGVRGTPTIWLNGWLFDQGRSVAALRERAEELGYEGG